MLALSRNTVRRILRTALPADGEQPDAPSCAPEMVTRIEDAYRRAGGNVVRVAELIAEEHALNVPYSTLTRWVREAGLREPPRRAGTYTFDPGEEMQHDTSPHRIEIAGRTITAHCASLVLAFSRRLFICYYPRFTRFEAKAFLDAAFTFMDGVCPRCVIDNTSVVVVAGTGPDATIAVDMRAFAAGYGVRFVPHRLGHADRKARVERPFAYVERNFLAARRFEDFDDLNAQALRWCREIANAKPKRSLGMAPEAAYVLEKPHLIPLPNCRPPVYETHERIADTSGYVSLDTNRYSVPERFLGKRVTVYKYPADVRIYRRERLLATHPRLTGKRDARHTLPGHHPRPEHHRPRGEPEEQSLRGEDERLDRYVTALKRHAPGRGVRRLRRLLELKRTYPRSAFLAAIDSALTYGLYDLSRLEQLILRHVAGDFFSLGRNQDEDDD